MLKFVHSDLKNTGIKKDRFVVFTRIAYLLHFYEKSLCLFIFASRSAKLGGTSTIKICKHFLYCARFALTLPKIDNTKNESLK